LDKVIEKFINASGTDSLMLYSQDKIVSIAFQRISNI